MRQIGTILPAAQAGNPSPSVRSDLPARQPAISDKEVDITIPGRVWSAWIPKGGQRSIIRALTEHERSAIDRRRGELAQGLRPIEQGERDRLIADSALSAMIGGFRSMRQRGDGVDATVRVLLHVLRKFPCWAIELACELITTGRAGLDPTWPPNDAQIFEIVENIVAKYRSLHAQAEALLSAPVEPPPRETVSRPLPTAEQQAQQMAAMIARPEPKEGEAEPAKLGYMARVLADIEARKKAKEGANG